MTCFLFYLFRWFQIDRIQNLFQIFQIWLSSTLFLFVMLSITFNIRSIFNNLFKYFWILRNEYLVIKKFTKIIILNVIMMFVELPLKIVVLYFLLDPDLLILKIIPFECRWKNFLVKFTLSQNLEIILFINWICFLIEHHAFSKYFLWRHHRT